MYVYIYMWVRRLASDATAATESLAAQTAAELSKLARQRDGDARGFVSSSCAPLSFITSHLVCPHRWLLALL
jgi:hypothetical protein